MEIVRSTAFVVILALGCSKSTPPTPTSVAASSTAAESATPATSTTTPATTTDGGAGDTRSVPAFTKLSVSGSFVINVTMGNDGPLHLHCSEKVLPKVRTDVDKGTLDVRFEDGAVIRDEGPCTIDIPASTLEAIAFSGSVTGKVQGPVKSLSKVNISGSAQLSTDQVKADALAIILTGSGSLRLGGQASSVNINCSGSGQVNASALTAEEVRVQLSGSGEVRVNASRKIDAQVSGSGRVHVSGNPKERLDHGAKAGAVIFE